MLRYLSDYKRESVLAPLFKMLEATFDLFVPLVMADIVNVGIAAHDFHYILVRCGILLLLAIVGLACSLTAQYFSAKAAVGYSTGLRHALFEHIQTLSFSEMDTMGTSTLITRMTSDVNQVQSGLNLFLRLFLRSPFVVIGAMIMAFTVNFRAALIFVVAIPLLSVVVFGVMVITRPLYKSVQTRLDRVLGLTRENLTGVRVVRAFDKEKSEVDRFEDANELLTKMQLHVGHISALMNPLTYVIINLAIVALLYVGSIEINIGGMASGDVIALVNYMNQILVELVKLANLIVQVSKALACAGRVQAVLDTKPGMEFPAQLTGNVPAEKVGDAVRFDHVSLTYKGAGAPSLSDISFTAKRGQTIGVIGGTGSGKSSLVNLVLITALSLPCVLGYNLWAWDGFAVFGGAVLDFEDFLVSNLFLPLGSLVYLLFCVTRYGWGWDNYKKEVNTGRGLKMQDWMRGYLTYVLPVIVLFIFAFGIYDKFFA